MLHVAGRTLAAAAFRRKDLSAIQNLVRVFEEVIPPDRALHYITYVMIWTSLEIYCLYHTRSAIRICSESSTRVSEHERPELVEVSRCWVAASLWARSHIF